MMFFFQRILYNYLNKIFTIAGINKSHSDLH